MGIAVGSGDRGAQALLALDGGRPLQSLDQHLP